MAKPNTNSNQKADFAVKLVLIFFISLLSFSIGTYLGKQVSDADHQRAAREAEYGMGTEKKVALETDEETEAIRDEEVASLTEEFLRASRNTASESPAATETTATPSEKSPHDGYTHHSKMVASQVEEMHSDTPASSETNTTTAQPSTMAAKTSGTTAAMPSPTTAKVEQIVQKAAQRIAEGMAPTADPVKKRAPTAALPSVATTAVGKYTVQVASYATSAEADAYAEKLLAKGYPAFVVTAEVSGKTWHRVSIGRFPDQNAAKSYRGELLSAQAVSTAIVQKVIQ